MKLARAQKSAEKFANLAQDLKETDEKDVLSHGLLDALVAGDTAKSTAVYLEFYTRWLQSHAIFSVHFVICLDESGSMFPQKFPHAQRAVENFLQEAAVRTHFTASTVSLVMFNAFSLVACDQIPLDQHSNCTNSITGRGGGTAFGPPLDDAMHLVQNNKDKYDKQFVLFYTDGEAPFPAAQANNMKRFKDSGENLDFFAIAETKAHALDQICQTLYPSSPVSDHCQSHVTPEKTVGAMQEALRRMSVAFVQP